MTRPAREQPTKPGLSPKTLSLPAHLPALAALALVLLTAISYLPAMLWGGFVWDDGMFIVDETAVRDWSGLWRFWFAPTETAEPHYRPLTYTTFWLEHKLWGYAPRGYHIVNVLLHAANVLLLWLILSRLAVSGAWLVAAVFAVHPLHVESVAWVIERKDVLSGLFYLACVLAWLPFLDDDAENRAPPAATMHRYCSALALFAAGLLAKNMVVTLPAVLLVLHWWRNGRISGRDALRLAPFFGLTCAFIAVDMWSVVTAAPVSFGLSVVDRVLIAARALWFYVGTLVWPADLAVIYPRWEAHADDAAAWLALIAALALAATLWFARGRTGRGPLAGALVYAVALSPTLGFVDHTYMLFSFVADRYQYLACIGVMAVLSGVAALVPLPPRWRMGAWGGAAAVLLLLGALTWRQSSIYRDQLTFFEHVVAHNPEAAGAHLNIAQALIDENRLEEAVQAATVAVAQRPDSYDAHINLAVALGQLERFEESERHLRHAVEIAPAESAPRANLGVLLSRRNEFEEAERQLRRALELSPRDLGVLRNLAKLLALQGRSEEALALYDRAVTVDAGDVAAHTARGDLLVQLGRHDDALAAWRRALDHAPPPSAFALHLSMGRAEWAKNGDAHAAARHHERALALRPRHIGVLGDLAQLRVAQERYQDAQALFLRAIELTPDNATLHAGRGYALYRLGEADAAVDSLQRALALDPTLDDARSYLALAAAAGTEDQPSSPANSP